MGLPSLAPFTAEGIIANKLKQDMFKYEGKTPTNENEAVFNAIMEISTEYRNRNKFSYSVMKEKEAQKLADNYLIVKNYLDTKPDEMPSNKEEREAEDERRAEFRKAYHI